VIFLSVENKSLEIFSKLRKKNVKELKQNNDVSLDSWTLSLWRLPIVIVIWLTVYIRYFLVQKKIWT